MSWLALKLTYHDKCVATFSKCRTLIWKWTITDSHLFLNPLVKTNMFNNAAVYIGLLHLKLASDTCLKKKKKLYLEKTNVEITYISDHD